MANNSTNRAKHARLEDDDLVAELEAALDERDKAEMEGDMIAFLQHSKAVMTLEREIALREALVDDLELIAV